MPGGKVSGKAAVITINSQNLSSDSLTYTINYAVDTHDVTGFGDGSHNFIAGMPIRDMDISFLYDSTSTTGSFTVMQAAVQAAVPITCSIVPEVGGKTYSGSFLPVGITVSGDTSSPIKLGTVKFLPGSSTAPSWA